MHLAKQSLAMLLGFLLGVLVSHVNLVKAQTEPAQPELGVITVTAVNPKVKVHLFPNERFLGFSCGQDQCYVATME